MEEPDPKEVLSGKRHTWQFTSNYIYKLYKENAFDIPMVMDLTGKKKAYIEKHIKLAKALKLFPLLSKIRTERETLELLAKYKAVPAILQRNIRIKIIGYGVTQRTAQRRPNKRNPYVDIGIDI